MINFIKLIDFQDIVQCKSCVFQSKETFMKINYEFKKGNVYGLASDYGCGGWGVATCLGGRSSNQYFGKVLLEGIEINPQILAEYSCFVSENKFLELNLNQEMLTVRNCIEQALNLSNLSYSANEIKSMFCLSDERFDRPLNFVSGEIWQISIAIGFALGKDIFCYPWLNEHDIFRFEVAYKHGIIKLLKDSGKLVLIPSSQKQKLRKYCDHTIIFSNHKLIYR